MAALAQQLEQLKLQQEELKKKNSRGRREKNKIKQWSVYWKIRRISSTYHRYFKL